MKGMTAIVTVIVLGVVLVLIGAMMSLSSINSGQVSFELQKKDTSSSLTEACVEEGMLKINESDTLPAVITTGFGTCPVVVNSHTGTSWDFTVSNSINVKLNRGTTLAVSTWQEQ